MTDIKKDITCTFPKTMVITDSTLCITPLDVTLRTLMQNGTRWIGIREYGMSPSDVSNLIEEIKPMADSLGVFLSVWQLPEVALRFNIGLHLPAMLLKNENTKNALSKQKFRWNTLGFSVHDMKELHAVESIGISDYIVASPVFDSISKQGYKGIGIDRFETIASASSVPTYALGGVTPNNMSSLLQTSGYGIAVCGFSMHNPTIDIHYESNDCASDGEQ